ncbi:MAG: heparin lyase I family protein [Solirubrobacteraceae bacterium]
MTRPALLRWATIARSAFVVVVAASSTMLAVAVLAVRATPAYAVDNATSSEGDTASFALGGVSTSTPPSSTIGKATVGASCGGLFADHKRVNEYPLGSAATITSMAVWLQPGTATGSQQVEGVIYADANGPGALVASTTAITFSSTQSAGWYTLNFASEPTLAAGNYWLGTITGGTANAAESCHDAGASGARAANVNPYASGPSSPFGAATYGSQLMSVYATYAAVGNGPGAPTNLSAAPGDGQVALSWSASTEAGGEIAGYHVYRNGVLVASVASSAYTDQAVTDGTMYSYYVQAYDEGGNVSPASSTVSTTPSAPATLGSCATAGTVWCGDFGPGDSSQYTELLGQPASDLSFPTSPVLSGLPYSARFQLRPGDLWTDGTSRMQLRQASFIEGQDLYFHFAVYIDPSTTIGGNFSNPWRTLVAWPTTQDGNCSPMKLMLMSTDGVSAQPNGTDSFVMAGDLGSCGATDVDQWVLPDPVIGAWYQFIVHIRFSASSSEGMFEFWMMPPGASGYAKQTFNRGSLNGTQAFVGNTIGHPGDSANLRLGIYRNPAFATTDVIDYAGVRAATLFAAAQ